MKSKFHRIVTPWIKNYFSFLYIFGNVWRCNTDRNMCTSLPLHCLVTTTATWRDYHQLIPCSLKARLHGSPRLINVVESTKLNSTVERYCLYSSTKVERGSRFQNGGKWTCAGRWCCDMWLLNERMSTHFRKKEIRGKKRRSNLSAPGNSLWLAC